MLQSCLLTPSIMYFQTNVLSLCVCMRGIGLWFTKGHTRSKHCQELREFFFAAVPSYCAFSIVLIVFHFCLLVFFSFSSGLVWICLMPVARLVSTYTAFLLFIVQCANINSTCPKVGDKNTLVLVLRKYKLCLRWCSKQVLQLQGSAVLVATCDVLLCVT